MKLRRRILVAVSFFALLAATNFFGGQCFAQAPQRRATRPAKKPVTPSQISQAKITQLSDATVQNVLKPKGKPLLVNFWATWCDPCRDEFPELVRIANEYKAKLDFVTISMDDAEEINRGVPKFLRLMRATQFANYLLLTEDEDSVIRSISKDWSGGLPFTILYAPEGEAAYTRQGKIRPAVLRAEIEKVLAAKAANPTTP